MLKSLKFLAVSFVVIFSQNSFANNLFDDVQNALVACGKSNLAESIQNPQVVDEWSSGYEGGYFCASIIFRASSQLYKAYVCGNEDTNTVSEVRLWTKVENQTSDKDVKVLDYATDGKAVSCQ